MTVLGLVVDTSIQGVSLALLTLGDSRAKDAGILWRGEHLENAGSIVSIADLLDKGLKVVGAQPQDLGAMSVSVGPGSFTGIKVGLAFVHGLRMGLPETVPVAALSSVEEAAATLARQRAAPYLGLFLPATRTHGYFTAVVAGTVAPAQLVAFDGEGPAIDAATLPDEAMLCVLGDWPAAEAWRPKPAMEKLVASAVCGAAIYGMSLKSQALWPDGFMVQAPKPRYLRLSTAEEKLASSLQGSSKP